MNLSNYCLFKILEFESDRLLILCRYSRVSKQWNFNAKQIPNLILNISSGVDEEFLNDCGIKFRGFSGEMESFAKYCSQFRVLELNLENCGLNDEKFAIFCKYLTNSSIERIKLDRNRIGIKTLIETSNCEYLKNLKMIYLNNVDIPQGDFEHFIEKYSNSNLWLNTYANYLLWNQSDIEKALIYYEKSAELGNSEAQYQYSTLICFGNVCNPKKSRYWLEMAANQDYSPALDSLADALKEEDQLERAFDLYHKSAAMGSSHSMYELSTMYRDGLYVGQDFPLSLIWLVKSANRGHLMASHELGMYYLSTGCNLSQAITYFVRSMEVSQSQLQLGKMYMNGNDIIPKNIEKAGEWLEKASLLEDEAVQLLEFIGKGIN